MGGKVTEAEAPQTDLWMLLKSALLHRAKGSSSILKPFLMVSDFMAGHPVFAASAFLLHQNLMAVLTFGTCALSVSAAVLLILDMDQPFSGLMQISIEPLLQCDDSHGQITDRGQWQ